MTDPALFLEAFHFLRPWLLVLLPVIAALWWAARRGRLRAETGAQALAPHLRAALTVGAASRRRLRPLDGAAMAFALAALGAAGPTWSRVPDPFAAQSAPVAAILKVAPSMTAGDVAPSRLERGKQKIRGFLERRAGARTALIAYAGTAHSVVPMTEDPDVMTPYLGALTPEVMPEAGDRAGEALALALAMLAQENAPGGVLLVTDAIDPADVAALNAAGAPLAVLALLPEGVRDRGIDALDAPVAQVTPDDADLARLERALDAAWRRAQLENAEQPWEDRGRWLAWPAAALTLIWFRRGWTMRWAALALVVAGAAFAPGGARAEGIADWFLTPDQQGELAARRGDFHAASDLYADPLHRGYALYRAGRYAEAREVLARLSTPEAAFIQGLAAIRDHAYRDGVRAFETTLERDPDFPDAAANLALAKRIVTYVEDAQEQSDTGEQPDLSADEETYDNEANRGQEMEAPASDDKAEAMPSTEQWMNAVDTRPADFLRQRFALEAARGPAADNAPSAPDPSAGPAPGAAGQEAPE